MTQHDSDNGVIIRHASVADIEAIVDLAESVPTSSLWPRVVYETVCTSDRATDDAVARALFIACAKNIQSPTKIIGFAVFSAVSAAGGAEYEIENIVVSNECRRRGIGQRLLAAGCLWCRTWRSASVPSDQPTLRPREPERPDSALWLEVRTSNRNAIAFYENAGFRISGRRPGYYAQPAEDAVLMTASLPGPTAAC